MARRAQGYRSHAGLFVRPLICLAALWLLTVVITGCAGKDFAELRPGLESRGHYIEGVPFYQEIEPACGPAALASILAFHGSPESLERIAGKICLPELRGTFPRNVETYVQEAGFKTKAFCGSIGELKGYIRKGVPVICMLDLGTLLYHEPYYISVIGYDDTNGVFIGHDGLTPNRMIGYEKFNTKWVRAGQLMLVIEPGSGKQRNEK